MATACADPDACSPEHLAAERRMRRVMRTITGHRWRQRLAPLAEFMGNRRMVRARSDCGAALALLALDTLQQALARLLGHAPVQGYLVVRLAVENAPAADVAAEPGLDPAHATEDPHQGRLVGVVRLGRAAPRRPISPRSESVAFAGAVEEPSLAAVLRRAHRPRQ